MGEFRDRAACREFSVKVLEHICMGVVTVAVVFALVELGLLTRETRFKVDALAGQAQGTLTDVHRVVLITGGAVNQLRDTIRDTQKSNKALAANSAAATAALNADQIGRASCRERV